MILADNTSKAVVFTQYLGNLEVISEELASRGIKFARVDAMMKQHQRADNIMSFTDDPTTKVLLLSMKAGAAGLNLVVANHCFLLDPALNSGKRADPLVYLHEYELKLGVFFFSGRGTSHRSPASHWPDSSCHSEKANHQGFC